MAGIEHLERAVLQPDGCQVAGHEPVLANLLGDGAVHLDQHGRQIFASSTGVAIRRHRLVRDANGLQAVTHGVQDRQLRDVAVHGLVEGVAGEFVASRIMPDRVKAEMHRKMAEPGSADE